MSDDGYPPGTTDCDVDDAFESPELCPHCEGGTWFCEECQEHHPCEECHGTGRETEDEEPDGD